MKYFFEHIRQFIAVLTVMGSFGFLYLVFFKEIPTNNQRLADIVTGFVIGTGVAAVYQWLYGTSKNETDKVKNEVDTQKIMAEKLAEGTLKQEININPTVGTEVHTKTE